MELTRDKAVWMYEKMRLIRAFEERVATLFAKGEIPGFVHLYAGEEAVGVGVISCLADDDYLTSTHRGHGHCIAKDLPLGEIMAEIFGKTDGLCRGKGGSMHVADLSRRMLGANGIIGAGPPLAVGAALSAKLLKTGAVTVCFFGDGAAAQGTTHEAMNLASVWQLPVVFVCENNQFAESTPWTYHTAATSIADRASAYNMPGVLVQGDDVMAVCEVAGEAIARARRGEGPSLIEARTWRYFGHFEGDQVTYRSAEQSADYRQQHDPLKLFGGQTIEMNLLTEKDIERIGRDAEQQVYAAIDFAGNSPLPAPEEALTDVYVSY
jgi:pyruvate dehydrogenase E1 component alpha subunit